MADAADILGIKPRVGSATAALLAKIQANPVGTERANDQSLTNPTPGIDPIVGRSPYSGQMVTALQAQAERERAHTAAAMTLGMMGTMAGPGAVGADMDALGSALAMERGGETPEAIHAATQWFRGADGEWRFEIPDSKAQLAPDVRNKKVAGQSQSGLPEEKQWVSTVGLRGKTAGDILDHPALFKAYPELAKTPVRSTGLAQMDGLKGAVYENGDIGLSAAKPDELLSTLLHEVQHKVQAREGFARGGNPQEFLPPGYSEQASALTKTVQDFEGDYIRKAEINPYSVRGALERQAAGRPLGKYDQTILEEAKRAVGADQLAWHSENLAEMRRLEAVRNAAYENYRRLAGETESRNVQARHKSNDYTSFPLSTQDVPAGEQIVTYKGQRP